MRGPAMARSCAVLRMGGAGDSQYRQGIDIFGLASRVSVRRACRESEIVGGAAD